MAAGGRRPNVILILADDMGFADLGCFGSEIRRRGQVLNYNILTRLDAIDGEECDNSRPDPVR